MTRPLDIVVFGLTLSSTWGNGHATTYRALLRGLAGDGHRVLFLEADRPWYAAERDLPEPGFCDFALYDDLDAVLSLYRERIAGADAVIVGSYVPDAITLIDRLAPVVGGVFAFYDIDTPVTLAALRAGGAAYLAERQVPLFDLHLSFAGGPALAQLRAHGARRPVPLYCAVDPERHAPIPGVVPRWDLGYLGTYSADRQEGLERFLIDPARRLPERRFVVAGAQYPDGIDWPANVERIAHLPAAEHSRFFAAQRFTLNLTRAAMRETGWSPSVRLFEAAACGTPIVSDDWPGLGSFLPEGSALLVARKTGDVVAALTALPEPRRAAIAQEARDRVLARHSGRARAGDLAAALRSAAALGPVASRQEGASA
jgi:spore maturation protein CgeB